MMISDLTVRLQALINPTPPEEPAAPVDCRPLTRKLGRVQAGLDRIDAAIAPGIPEEPGEHEETEVIVDCTQLSQYLDELSDYKTDLAALYNELACEDIPDDDTLFTTHSELERQLSTSSSKIKTLLIVPPTEADSPRAATTTGVKLPKLDVPVFDGNIIRCKQFWDQFAVAVHNKTNLSNAEKTVYLQHAIKDGSAKSAIEGLSHSGDNYEEAVDCLKACYDRPRLIQRSHVQLILDTLPVKEASGKELRRLHDVIQQHLCTLKTLGCDLPGQFITSMIELKLDVDTLFEWQKLTHTETEVPHYQQLLEFIDSRAVASETSCVAPKKSNQRKPPAKVAAHASASDASSNCPSCVTEKHPLYTCTKFKAMTPEEKMEVVKTKRLCVNCLGGGHFKSQSKSVHKCKECQKPHHTLLHVTGLPSHPATRVKSDVLLMTSRVLITAPDGSTVETRALLDNASSASLISERLVNSLSLPRSTQDIRVSGIGGMSHKPPLQSVVQFQLSSLQPSGRKIDVATVVVPKVTCDLPMSPIAFHTDWKHLSDVPLADPNFNRPGRIDILFGANVYVDVLCHGRRDGPPGSPTAFETDLGWVICGSTSSTPTSVQANVHITTFHTSFMSSDDVLRKFWELEESPSDQACLSAEERMVVHHFESSHTRSTDGRLVVPLPKDPSARPLGESRSQAVRRFLSLERTLNQKGQEYLELKHAEEEPTSDLEKPPELSFYLPMHAVYKTSSTTTKIRAVFDASAKSSTGVSLNDTLLVGPTLHPPLVDVLLQFRLYPVALMADISKMYRAVKLTEADKDLHRFVWRSHHSQSLKDYRMTRVTFGVSASLFAANMAVKQNAVDHADDFPVAAEVVPKSFYVDDCLTGASDSKSALQLQQQLTQLFPLGGFVLRKWNLNDPFVLKNISEDLRDSCETHTFSEDSKYSKTLGIEWNIPFDQLHLNVSDSTHANMKTKRNVVSGVAKVFDALGLFSPVTIKMKIFLQRLWEIKLDWDDPVPEDILEVWSQWRCELPSLSEIHIPRCYMPSGFSTSSMQLHGYSNASEEAYTGVVYLRLEDQAGHISTQR